MYLQVYKKGFGDSRCFTLLYTVEQVNNTLLQDLLSYETSMGIHFYNTTELVRKLK